MRLPLLSFLILVCSAPLFVLAEEAADTRLRGLSDANLEQLRSFVTLANQELSDRSGFEETTDIDHNQVQAMIYELATQQFCCVAAYRDLYRKTISRLIERTMADPANAEAAIPMIALYEMLYRDRRWSETDSPLDESLSSVFQGEVLKLYENPWDRKDFGHPLLAGVDFPNILVRRAFWDDKTETLRFTLEPSGDEAVLATFRIENLYTNYLAVLEKDGEYLAAFDEHAQVAGANTRNLDPGSVEIRTTISGLTEFVLAPME